MLIVYYVGESSKYKEGGKVRRKQSTDRKGQIIGGIHKGDVRKETCAAHSENAHSENKHVFALRGYQGETT